MLLDLIVFGILAVNQMKSEKNHVFCFSVDQITIPSKTGRGVLKRVPEVFDCWFESGR